MADTFPDLLSTLVREDGARPLVTFYDDTTGERVELSVATYANWVAKTSSLFVEELDLELGDTVLVDLPTHWLGPVFLGAAWNAGLVVAFPDDVAAAEADAVVCGPDGLGEYAGLAASVPVIACSLLPLGVRFAEALPPGVHDFGVEVWSQPDSFLPLDSPGPASDAVHGQWSHAELVSPTTHELAEQVGRGGRLLTTANPASPTGLASFVSPLVSHGSTVLVRNADRALLADRYAAERATHLFDQPPKS